MRMFRIAALWILGTQPVFGEKGTQPPAFGKNRTTWHDNFGYPDNEPSASSTPSPTPLKRHKKFRTDEKPKPKLRKKLYRKHEKVGYPKKRWDKKGTGHDNRLKMKKQMSAAELKLHLARKELGHAENYVDQVIHSLKRTEHELDAAYEQLDASLRTVSVLKEGAEFRLGDKLEGHGALVELNEREGLVLVELNERKGLVQKLFPKQPPSYLNFEECAKIHHPHARPVDADVWVLKMVRSLEDVDMIEVQVVNRNQEIIASHEEVVGPDSSCSELASDYYMKGAKRWGEQTGGGDAKFPTTELFVNATGLFLRAHYHCKESDTIQVGWFDTVSMFSPKCATGDYEKDFQFYYKRPAREFR